MYFFANQTNTQSVFGCVGKSFLEAGLFLAEAFGDAGLVEDDAGLFLMPALLKTTLALFMTTPTLAMFLRFFSFFVSLPNLRLFIFWLNHTSHVKRLH